MIQQPSAHRGSAGSSTPRDPWGAVALLAAAFAVAAFLIHEIYSLDVWWQVTIGRNLLERLSVPTVDRFSAAGWGRPYHDSHWLFQGVLALAHRLAGMVGVEGVMVGLWGLTLAVTYRSCRRWVSAAPAAILTFLAAMASVERFLPRPELVTFAGIALFVHRLQERRFRGPRDLLALALIQIVWANSHGLFVFGPFLVGCTWLAAAVARLRGEQEDLAAPSRALGVVLAASLATPFGFAGWRYAALLALEAGGGGAEVIGRLGELSATFGQPARSSPAFGFFITLLVLSAGAAGVLVRQRLSGRLLAVAGCAAAALSGRRNVVLLALVAAPFAAEALARWWPRPRRPPRWLTAAAAAAMAAWALYPLSGAYYLAMEIPARWGVGVTPSFFPHTLPAFLERVGFEGQVLNSNTLGGFYLYHGYPQRVPLTDGRWEVYDPDELSELLALSRDPDGWRRLVEERAIGGILLAHTSAEARAWLPSLARAGDWRLVYLDRAASFWMPEGAPRLPPAVDLSDPAELPIPLRPDDGWILHAFLRAVGAAELQRLNLERTLGFGVQRRRLLEQLGPLQLTTHRYEEAERTYRELVTLDPRNASALNELAFLAYNRGDLERARGLLERALEIEPEDLEMQENHRRVLEALQREAPAPPEAEP